MKTQKIQIIVSILVSLIIIVVLVLTVMPTGNSTHTDLNGDRKTDTLDLKILQESYGLRYQSTDTVAVNTDLNGDSITNAADLSIMLSKLNAISD